MGDTQSAVDAVRGETMFVRIRAESLGESIEAIGVEGHRAAVRYKRARRVARRCMNRARNLQSRAMTRAKQMAGLRTELVGLQRQCEWLQENAAGDLAKQISILKADVRSISELVECYATDADGTEQEAAE